MSIPDQDRDTEAHDVLAAEEFAMPTLDPTIHHAPVKLPEDPGGVTEPHDILAAEEFPMPAVRPWETSVAPVRSEPAHVPIVAALTACLLVLVVRRYRHRHRRQRARRSAA